ncbi:hypothetical protein QQM79_01100 [Marinobacteraceae bacterium S3BR75-40.1]
MLLLSLTAQAEDATASSAENKQRLSFEACSMVASEYLTVTQLYEKGFSAEQLKEALPGITDQGRQRVQKLYEALEEEGVVETYSNINSRFARCAKSAYKAHGKPQPGSREDRFYFCAGENKLRYEVVLAAWAGGTAEQILPQIPESRREVARKLIQIEEDEGIRSVFEELAQAFKACVNKAR